MREGVRKRGDIYYFQYVEIDEHGKRRRREARAVDHGQPNTERGASLARAAMQTKVAGGHRTSSRSIADICARYIEEQPDLKPSSRYNYGIALRTRVKPFIGDMPAQALTPEDVTGWMTRLARAGYQPGAIRVAHALVSGALARETRARRLPSNVARLAAPPSAPRPTPTAWPEDRIAAFVAAARDETHGALWITLILTGLRIGEATALTWADLDLDAGALLVQRTRSVDERGKPMVGAPKTPSGRRALALPADVTTALRALRDRAAFRGQRDPQDRVFGIGPRWANQALTRFCAQHGFPRVTPHQLRDIQASWLIAAGVDQRAVASRLGHARLSMLDAYVGLTPGADSALAAGITARLDALAANASGNEHGNLAEPARESLS